MSTIARCILNIQIEMNQSEALDDVASNKDEISGAVELHCLFPQLVESWDPQKKRKRGK